MSSTGRHVNEKSFIKEEGRKNRREKEWKTLWTTHFLSFPAISSLDANSLAVYKEANTRKSYSRFYFEPLGSAGAESYKEFKRS